MSGEPALPVEAADDSVAVAEPAPRGGYEAAALMLATFLIACCGLFYQFILGTLAGYLFGDSVTQFPLTIGLFLAAMGVGAWLSRFVDDLPRTFLLAELALGLLGAWSATLLLAAFAHLAEGHRLVFVLLTTGLGMLIGLELPLLLRWARRFASLRETLARLFALDYLGALVAGLLFPLLLLPRFGVVRTAFLVGAVNLAVVLLALPLFQARARQRVMWVAVGAIVLVAGGFRASGAMVDALERKLYQDPVVLAQQTPYQRIVMTLFQDDLRLFLDRELQFSARDEYRYHEALVHPAMAAATARARVLVIGGGDGLVAREILKYGDVRALDLVDLDPAVTRLGREFPALRALNADALHDPRVRVTNADGFRFVAEGDALWDVAIVDLPDPRNEAIARLYSREFYGMLARRLEPGGVMVTQASSPFMVREAYWTVVASIEAAGLEALPYRTFIPTFGDWGFVLAGREPPVWPQRAPAVVTRYLDAEVLRAMPAFSADVALLPMEPSTLTQPRVLQRYQRESVRWR